MKQKRKLIASIRNGNKNVTAKETIYAIKNAGFDGVFIELNNYKAWPFPTEQQIKLCQKLNLSIEFAHFDYHHINDIWVEGKSGEKKIENFIHDLDEMKKYNIKTVFIHLSSKFTAPPPSELGIKRLQKVVNYAEKLDIKVAFENNKIFGYLEYVLDRIKNDNAGVCFDSGHFHCYYDAKFSWDKFKNKIFAVHFHDNNRSGDDTHLLPFDGTADWDNITSNLNKANYTGPVILEVSYDHKYLDMTIDDFYKEAYKRATQIEKDLDCSNNLTL